MKCLVLSLFAVIAACAEPADGVFVPEPDDEEIDPADPPLDPDPLDTEEFTPSDEELAALPELPTDDEALEIKARCPKRPARLSPVGLTFVIHISKHEDEAGAALRQLKDVRRFIRARDIFMIERKAPVVAALRRVFPCNDFHFIAYPDELDNAFALGKLVDGIAVDWEGAGVWSNPQSFSIDKLRGYAAKIHNRNQVAGLVPYWPNGFNDGHIVNASNMNYELAQIQNRCANDGAEAFALSARSLIRNFRDNNLALRDFGAEISLSSFAFADNHTGVDRSAACTRKAYGKGTRAIYLYGNGHPHYDKYFRRIARMGLRGAR
ncbi:MAG TPA: hypothetical protein VIV11_00695 [Kofleriaceae bacterium]